jgi:hypothetical protein
MTQQKTRKIEDFSWSYKGFECHAQIESDDPFVWAQQRCRQNPIYWQIDFPNSYFVEKQPFQQSLDECILKLEMLIEASCIDPLIKKRLPKELFDGYQFQCSQAELREILDKLIPVPGQLSLFSSWD